VACKKEMFALLGEYISPNIVEKIEAAMIKLVEGEIIDICKCFEFKVSYTDSLY
jgi:hypothetical protein